MKKISVKPIVPDFLAVMKDGGADIPVVIDNTVVGRLQFDANAAAKAIFKAGLTPQEMLLHEFGSLRMENGLDAAVARAAMIVASAIGVELRVYANLLAQSTSRAMRSVGALVAVCPGCDQYFIPALDRRKKGARGGRPSTYCKPACLTRAQKKTPALAKKAAAERRRRERKILESLELPNESVLKALRTDAKSLRLLERANPTRFHTLKRHILGRKHSNKRGTKPRVN